MKSIILLLLLMSSCSSYHKLKTPAYEYGSGYSDSKLKENMFLLRYDGLVNTKYKYLKIKLLRRASELCSGSFEIKEYAVNTAVITGIKKVSWPFVTATLHCTKDTLVYTLPNSKSTI